MAISNSKAMVAFLLLSVFVLHLVGADGTFNNSTAGPKIDCGAACAARCKLSSRPNLCNRACGTCCARCNCVPPGTAGNFDACPCYANMTTHGNKRKCP